MSVDPAAEYDGPSALVRRLHDYPRLHSRNTFPSFSDPEETANYYHMLQFVVALPLSLLLLVYLGEVAFRVAQYAKERKSGVSQQRPRVGSAEDSSEARAERRRTLVVLRVALGLVAACTVAAVTWAVLASVSAGTVGSRLGDLRDLVHGYHSAAQTLVESSALIQENCLTILNMTSLPVLVVESLHKVQSEVVNSSGNLGQLVAVLGRMDVGEVASDYGRFESALYGPASVTTLALTAVSVLMLLFCAASWRWPADGRSGAASAGVVVLDAVSALSLLGLAALVFAQLALVMAESDACVDPVTSADSIFQGQLGSDATALSSARYYAFCDGTTGNPLDNQLGTANTTFVTIFADFEQVIEYADSAGDPLLTRLVGEVGHAIVVATASADDLGGMSDCTEAHNTAYAGVNQACGPLVSRSYELLVVEGVLLGLWIVARGAASYRCLGCRRRVEEDEGDREDAMGLGLVANDFLDNDGTLFGHNRHARSEDDLGL